MVRTLAQWFSRKRTDLRRGRTNHNCRIRPAISRLEDRAVPAAITWTGGTGGTGTNWADPANWSPAQVPGVDDDAVIPPSSNSSRIDIQNASVRSITHPWNTLPDLYLSDTGSLSIGAAVSSFNALNLQGGSFFAASGATINGLIGTNKASSTPLSNSGLLTLQSGEIDVVSKYTNSGTLLQMGAGSRIYATNGFDNSGTVEAVNGTGWIGISPITTSANSVLRVTATTQDSYLYFGPMFLTTPDGFTNNGLIELNSAVGAFHARVGKFEFGSNTYTITNSSTGILSGNGIIYADIEGTGTISPGLAGPGQLTINGHTTLNGSFNVDLKGTTAGAEFDQLVAKGGVSVGGSLSVNVNYSAKVGESFVIIDNDGTDDVMGTFAGLPQFGTFSAAGTLFQINYKGGTGNDVVLTVIPPPPYAFVQSTTINDNDAQRSRVTNVKVTFDSLVTLPTAAETTFELRRQSDNALVGLAADVNNTTRTIVTLTFNGALSEFGSLADGRYTLTAFANKINGGAFDGNQDGSPLDNYVLASTGTSGVFRLFGDSDGNARVDSNDFAAFRMMFGLGGSIFDFDGDSQTSSTDFAEFRKRFGLMI